MGKKIIICCDGTWKMPEKKIKGGGRTNILNVVRAIKPSDSKGKNQIVYYDKGIGTGGFFDRIIGGATGKGISNNIKEAYRFLANNYDEDDEIYCFGFSRGAYTVRSLGGLIATIGILPKSDMDKLTMIYQYYRTPPKKRSKLTFFNDVKDLKEKATNVRIKFMGVWDTVGSLGAPTPFLGWITRKLWVGFHDTELRNTDCAYHALAIDERRGPFAPSIWTESKDCLEMKQVWFSGAHSNIGGGYPDARLSDLTFEWMVKMAEARGLEFNPEYLENKVNACYKGEVIDSFTFAYQLLRLLNVPMYRRPIGHKHRDVEGPHECIHEMIHQSAVDRHKENMPTFNRKNLQYGIDNVPKEPY